MLMPSVMRRATKYELSRGDKARLDSADLSIRKVIKIDNLKPQIHRILFLRIYSILLIYQHGNSAGVNSVNLGSHFGGRADAAGLHTVH